MAVPALCVSVSRLFCESESFKMDLILDVNLMLYPVELGKDTLLSVLTAVTTTATTTGFPQVLESWKSPGI